MCSGAPPSGMTEYAWAGPAKPDERMKFDCAHCGSVNRWMAGDKPPEKCRSCGAPERA